MNFEYTEYTGPRLFELEPNRWIRLDLLSHFEFIPKQPTPNKAGVSEELYGDLNVWVNGIYVNATVPMTTYLNLLANFNVTRD